MKKILSVILVILLSLSLISCFEDDKPAAGEEETDISNDISKTEAEETDKRDVEITEEKKPGEYDPSAWVKDNLSVSFYLYYTEGSDSNELITLKVCDGTAVMFSKKGDAEERPTSLYQETDSGLVHTSLMNIGGSKIAYRSLPEADKNFENALPQIMYIAGSFGRRIDSNPIKGYEYKGTDTYIGRKCEVYENTSYVGKTTFLIDSETGIILKAASEYSANGENLSTVSILVTELEYGKVSQEDVAVNLDEYKMTYEE